ncbi:MAG TPA: rhodanese-like domain-containing protein [Fontimonas sp.]
MQIIEAAALRDRLARNGIHLLDVRSAEELELARIDAPLTHIPMQELPQRLAELSGISNPDAPIAVLCHHGMRSEMAARFLERNGFTDVFNVAGGIDAWSVSVDPSVPRY